MCATRATPRQTPAEAAGPARAVAADIVPGARLLPGHLDAAAQRALLAEIRALAAAAPLYRPTMPKTGRPFSVRMTNAGTFGWVADRRGGYRYERAHPETGAPWPPIPEPILAIWRDVTGLAYDPEACLVNWYAPDAKMGLHRDADEEARDAPVVSISLGDDARFRLGGPTRKGPTRSLTLSSGDVLVLDGAARHAYHGVDRLYPGTSTLLDAPGRLNLTLRRVSVPDTGA